MIIGIIGTGYVGLVTGTCLSDMGHTVYCFDIDSNKINELNNGIIPIYEPGLDALVKANAVNDRLFFTTELEEISKCDAVFSCVGTPQKDNGACDLKYVLKAAESFGKYFKKHAVFINKSTAPIGTVDAMKKIIEKQIKKRGEELEFEVVSNPEFLKEGSAVDDFMNPDRIIIGCDTEYAKVVMQSIYKSYEDEVMIFMSIRSAEMTKYAANSMLATRISFINEIANLCDETGANVKEVAHAIGLDTRIGPKFLNAGCGYGGSCFPKDVRALINTGEENHVTMRVITAVDEANTAQKHLIYQKLYQAVGKSSDPIKNIAILGLSFKPNTDDMRYAPSIVFVNDLLNDDLKLGPFDSIRMYDPIALENAKNEIGTSNEKFQYCTDIDTTIMDADAIIILTEWEKIKNINLEVVKKLMRGNILIDCRNILDRKTVEEAGFIYEGIGT